MPEDNEVFKGESAESDERPGLSVRRRGVLAGTAGFASVALAGCAGDEEPTEAPTDEPTDEPTDTPEPQPENYVITDTVLMGSDYIPEGTGGFASACAPTRRFVPEMTAVFHIGIWDPATGDAVGEDTVDSAVVELDGVDETVELAFDDEAGYWSGSWQIPEDTEPQTVSFSISVENDGEYRRVGDLATEFEIIEFEDPASNYFVTVDTYATSDMGDYENTDLSQSCLPNSLFFPGMHVGFAAGVYDANNGDIVDSDTIEELVIEYENGDTLELEWQGDAEENAADEWSAAYTIPEDTEPGTLGYEVMATAADDADVEFYHVGIFKGELTVVEE